jgi:GNAT superfamily N-acetyltransferase
MTTTRIANAGDFQSVMPMMRQHRLLQQGLDPGLYDLHPDAERRFRQWIGQVARDPRSTLLVAEADGQIVGFLSATIERDPPIYQCEEYAVVREWWVEPASRGRGLGRALVERAAAEFATFGLRQLRVRTPAVEAASRSLLAGCGFRPGTCEMVINLPLTPTVPKRRAKVQTPRRQGRQEKRIRS